jgi:23S rRNA (cytidine1920-2'-O)/16S rRNA (cytidine1409-2'-O)-methyltransferase
VHRAVLREVRDAAGTLGLPIAALIASPLLGPAGNREFLAELRAGAAPIDDERIDRVVGEGQPA